MDCILTYNGETFDRPMLNKRCQYLGIPCKFFDKNYFPGIDGYHDCVKQAKKENLFGLQDKLDRKWKLSLVAAALNLNAEGAHDALADVLMLKNIYFMLDPILHPNNSEKTNLF